uniref:Uncharacterized protein n=1 Tax=Synechococcus phage S-SCSM1 TaxID=2588487 RepID=A0A6M2ZHG3_9CAUD
MEEEYQATDSNDMPLDNSDNGYSSDESAPMED